MALLTRVTRLAGPPAPNRFGAIALTPPSVPGPVQALTVVSVSYDRAQLQWSPPVAGGLPTGWRGRYSSDGGATWSAPVTLANSPAPLIGLAPLTAYLVQVAGINDTGLGEWSEFKATTTTAAPAPPDALVSLVATTIRRTAFGTSWSVPTTGGIPTSYDRRWRIGAAAWTVEIGVERGAALTGLSPATAVEWQARGVNGAGTGQWSASLTTTTAAEFAVPAVAGLADWRNLMESAEAGRRNWATGALGEMVGAPVMEAGGTKVTSWAAYYKGVPEKATQTIYVVTKFLGPITGSADRPVVVGSRVSNAELGLTIYTAGTATGPAAVPLRIYAGFTDGTAASAQAGAAALDLSAPTLLRGQCRAGIDLSFADLTHGVAGPVVNISTKTRLLSSVQPLFYGSNSVAAYSGSCILYAIVVVDGVPSVAEDAAIQATIRAEMGYWDVAEGLAA